MRRRAVRTRRRWRRSDARLVWRGRRLRVGDLPTRDKVVLLACLGVGGYAVALMLLAGFGRLRMPAITGAYSLLNEALPAGLAVLLFVGPAAGSAAIAAVADSLAPWRRAALLTGLALAWAMPCLFFIRLSLLQQAAYVHVDPDAVGLLVALRVLAGLAAAVPAAAALVAVVAALAPSDGIPGTPSRSLLRALTPWVHGGAPLLLLAGWCGAVLGGGALVGATGTVLPEVLPVHRILERSMMSATYAWAGLAMVLTLWSAMAAGRAASDVASRAPVLVLGFLRRVGAASKDGLWTLIRVVAVLKLLWVTAGLAHLLPSWLGAAAPVWAGILRDGALSWCLAAVLAVIIAFWMVSGCPAPAAGPGQVIVATALLVLALVLPELLFQLTATVYTTGMGDWAFDVAKSIEGVQPWVPVPVVIAAACACAVLWRARRWPGAVLVLGMFALWGGLRLPLMGYDMVSYRWYPWRVGAVGELNGPRPGWVDVGTLDLAVTAAVLVLSLLPEARRTRLSAASLIVVGAASTILGHAQTLSPEILLGGAGATLVFVFPVAYQLLFDAEGLNSRDHGRSRRLMSLAAVTTGALVIAALRSARGSPLAGQDIALAGTLLPVPVLAASLAVVLGRRRTLSGLRSRPVAPRAAAMPPTSPPRLRGPG